MVAAWRDGRNVTAAMTAITWQEAARYTKIESGPDRHTVAACTEAPHYHHHHHHTIKPPPPLPHYQTTTPPLQPSNNNILPPQALVFCRYYWQHPAPAPDQPTPPPTHRSPTPQLTSMVRPRVTGCLGAHHHSGLNCLIVGWKNLTSTRKM